MLDVVLKWPVRVAVLGTVVAAAVAGKCTEPIYSYMGAGGGATTAPPTLTIPTYTGRDSTVVAAGTESGSGMVYNPGDRNHLTTASFSYRRLGEGYSWGLSALGYQGQYTLQPAYYGTGQPLAYRGLGLSAHIATSFRADGIDWRPVVMQGSLTGEGGAWDRYRRAAPAQFDRPVRDSLGVGYHETVTITQRDRQGLRLAVRLGSEFVSLAPRPWSPVVGMGAGVLYAQSSLGIYGSVLLGSGPFRFYATATNLAGAYRPVGLQYGLVVGLPVGKRR